jgi:small subunit ribosomal protein S16
MLKIRLQRIGRRNHPAFRVVVTESARGPKSGNFIELLGSYNPHINERSLDSERISHWILKGAQPSDTVHNLLVDEKIITGKKKNVLPRKSPIVKDTKDGSPDASTESSPQETVEADAAASNDATSADAADIKKEATEEKSEETQASEAASASEEASETEEKK